MEVPALSRATAAAAAVAALLPRARAAFDAARAAAAATCARLQPAVSRACAAQRTASALLAPAGAPPYIPEHSERRGADGEVILLSTEIGADGTVLERHEGGLQVQRRPDGVRVVVFADGTVGQFPASAASENAVVQIPGEDPAVDPVVCQFIAGKNKGDVAVMSRGGDALQILTSEGGVLACKLPDGNTIQVSPDAAKMPAPPPEDAVAALDSYLARPEAFHVACRFSSSSASELEEGLKGCSFSVPSVADGERAVGKAQSLGLLHHAESSELAQSHWSEDRLVCVFRDGLVCERRPSGQVLIMQSLDDEVREVVTQAANASSSSSSSSSASSASASSSPASDTIDDLQFDNKDRVDLVKRLKEKQLYMEDAKAKASAILASAQAAYDDATALRGTADRLRALGDAMRKSALPLACGPLPDAQKAATDGLLRQESTQDGSTTTVIQYKDGTRVQRQVLGSAAGSEEGDEIATSVMLVETSGPAVAHAELKDAVYQQRSSVDDVSSEPTRSVVMLSDGTKIVHQKGTEDAPALQVAVVMALPEGRREPPRVQYRIQAETGQVELLTVVTGAPGVPAVQIMAQNVPERAVCIYADHETLEHVQISKNANNVMAGVVGMKSGSSHRLGPDGSFTIQIPATGSAVSEAIQLTTDGMLIVAKSDGTQWRWTGNELLSMQMAAGNNSPRARLQQAKKTDAALNN